jgi:hypothetical protein
LARDILIDGTRRARQVVQETLDLVKSKTNLNQLIQK